MTFDMKLEIDFSAVAVGVAAFALCHLASVLTSGKPAPREETGSAKPSPREETGGKSPGTGEAEKPTVNANFEGYAEPETEPAETVQEIARARSNESAQAESFPRVKSFHLRDLFLAMVGIVLFVGLSQSDISTPQIRGARVALANDHSGMQVPLQGGAEADQVGDLMAPEISSDVQAPSDVEAITLSVSDDIETVTLDASDAETIMVAQPSESTDAPLKKAPISVPLTRQRIATTKASGVLVYKSAYYASFSVGTPAEAFNLVLDTGSGHFILPSAYCHSETCRAHKRYRRSASSSAVDILADGTPITKGEARDEVTVSFGTGVVTGVLVEETVCLSDSVLQNHLAGNSTAVAVGGHDAASNVPQGCQKMNMIQATEMSEEPFKSFVSDGVLGLGLAGLSLSNEYNFLAAFSSSIAELGGQPKMFAFFLGSGQDEPSELSLGGYDDDRVEGDVKWNPVLDPEEGHWMIKLNAIRVDGEEVPFCNEGCKAVLDSGTSLLAMPSKAFPTIYKRLWHRAALDGNCEGDGPQIDFVFEHATITLGPEDYARPQKCSPPKTKGFGTGNSFESKGSFGATRNDLCCRPMLMSVDMEEPIGPKLFLLGEPVLQKYYTVYDAESMQIGIGKALHAPSAPSPPQDDSDDSWWYEEDEE